MEVSSTGASTEQQILTTLSYPGLAEMAKRVRQGTTPTFVEHDGECHIHIEQTMTHQHPEETLANAKLDAFLNELGTSQSEYKEPEGGDEPESEEDTYTKADLENDEPDTSIKIKKGGRKQKKGVVARNEISAAVAAMSDDPPLFVTATSRVGSRVGTKTSG